jgi:hypothetical protein
MPDDTRRVLLFSSPSDLLTTALRSALEAIGEDLVGNPASFGIDVWDGHPAISTTNTFFFGASNTTTHVMLGVADIAGAPPGFILDAPGMSSTNFDLASTLLVDNVSTISTLLQDYVENALIPFVEGVTGVGLSIVSNAVNSTADLTLGCVAISMVGTGPDGRIWCPTIAAQIRATITDPEDEFTTIQGNVTNGVQNGAVLVLGDGAPLGRIADALEVISLTDVEVSINHGQAMYSVNGKVTTG